VVAKLATASHDGVAAANARGADICAGGTRAASGLVAGGKSAEPLRREQARRPAPSYVGVVKSFQRLSERFGIRIAPHDVRDAAATTSAILAPD
jgi:hypothetical protein